LLVPAPKPGEPWTVFGGSGGGATVSGGAISAWPLAMREGTMRASAQNASPMPTAGSCPAQLARERGWRATSNCGGSGVSGKPMRPSVAIALAGRRFRPYDDYVDKQDDQDKRVRFLAKLPPELHRWLKIAAAERGANMNEILVASLDSARMRLGSRKADTDAHSEDGEG
jgi:hypothetical protein